MSVNSSEIPLPEGYPKESDTYFHSRELIDALSKQLTIPDSFYDVHNSLERSATGKNIQDPQVWLDALTTSEDVKNLHADIEFKNGRQNFRLSTDGIQINGTELNPKAQLLASLITGEAKLRAIQRYMPEAYAAGKGRVKKSIRQIERARKKFALTLDLPAITDLPSLSSSEVPHNFSLKWKHIVPAIVLTSLALQACQPTPVARSLAKESVPPPTPHAETVGTPALFNSTPSYTQLEAATPVEPQLPIPDLVYTGETLEYGTSRQDVIDRIEQNYGVKVICPALNENGEPNQLPAITTFLIIEDSLRSLPPAYLQSSRHPKEILLYQSDLPDLEGGLVANYQNRQLTLTLPTTFDFEEPTLYMYQEIYGSQEALLRAVVIHELTHSFTEAHPELIDDWIIQTGWIKNITADGSIYWSNDFLLQWQIDIDTYNPIEDLAISASIFDANPGYLTSNRQKFFLDHREFSDWQATQRNQANPIPSLFP
ncbi:MAG: hypothetical protein UW68_C0033G0016 [Candidatus Collierbacteria bacterium GW2011_GWB1_44_6]|uniref:Uncharacterized protein n=1 Tax=Candidatus Collierbacteria bacterium GW2011_GWB1_44_6 TaxID=1618384 RepID=A0A0G1MKN1_9BACT|nr:MAG: hypothetical protein UW68_C0033G0016 [Candidatus Collierbacteria bacterium GW2011_GWB1_44_6]